MRPSSGEGIGGMEERTGGDAEGGRFGRFMLVSTSWVQCHEALRSTQCSVVVKRVSWLRMQALERTAWVPILATQLMSPVALGKLLNQ